MPIRCAIRSLTIMLVVASIASSQQTIDQQIKSFETSLAGAVKLKGEESWTIQERMEHYGVPGLSMAVVKDNQVIWSKAYGVKDRETAERVTTDTLFQCASISKPVSAAAALRLVEQGVFDLDSNVNDFLKSWKLPENEFTQAQHVTLEHLVSHTGGVTVHGFLGYGDDLEVPSLIEVLNGSGPANSPAVRVNKKPGGDYRYSGGGYCIMQQMMIDAMGKPFPEIMDELVLRRLEMNKSTFSHPIPDARQSEVATGYLQNGDVVSGKQHTYPEMAPAGLYSTAREMASFFIEMQLAFQGTSDRIFSQKMAQRMMPDGTDARALGIGVKVRDGETYIGHGGWNEGFSSDANFHRDRGYGVVVLTNGNHPPLLDEIFNAVARTYNWHHYVLPEYEALNTNSEPAASISGRYDHQGSLLVLSEKDGKLWMKSDGSDPMELIRVGDGQLVCRNIEDVIYFSPASDSERAQISFKKPWADVPHPSNVARRLTKDERLPIEWLETGEFEKALASYRELKKSNPESPAVNEDRINTLGYQLMNSDRLKKAIDIFRINTLLHPEAFNAFDSLGEAYMSQGNNDLAVFNYEKSLELNPANENAERMISRIKANNGKENPDDK